VPRREIFGGETFKRSNFKKYLLVITTGTLVTSSVNGDIAIQWEWSNFDPSQNPNPLTDYDKTLHN